MKLFKRALSILLIIILINCGIIYAFVYRNNSSKLSLNEVEKIVAVLNSNDITVSQELIPKEPFNTKCHTFINSAYVRLDFVKKVFGDKYNVINSDIYEGERAGMSFSGNKFQINFYEPYMRKEFIKSSASDYGELIRESLLDFGFNVDDFIIRVYEKEQKAEAVLLLDGNPVYDISIWIKFSENGIYSFEGVLFEDAGDCEQKQCRTVFAVMYEVANDVRMRGKTIAEISYGYKADIEQEYVRQVQVYPVWRIVTEDNIAYYYNA